MVNVLHFDFKKTTNILLELMEADGMSKSYTEGD